MMKGLTQISAILFMLFLFACNDEDGQTNLRISMIDAPAAQYDEVNVEVMDVLINQDGNEEENGEGWVSVINEESKGQTFDLLSLTNGVEALLVDTEVPSGTISQIRLVLGENNYLLIGEETFELKTPSAQQSGLKLNVHEKLTEGVTYSVILDFDAAKSVITNGNGGYILKPVIRTITEASSGAIAGRISPSDVKSLITATHLESRETFNTYTDQEGGFLLKGVPAGDYQVTVDFPGTDEDGSIDDVKVLLGEVTDLGAQSFAFPN
jgi:hypothetical protein